jgi:hypothetical protein
MDIGELRDGYPETLQKCEGWLVKDLHDKEGFGVWQSYSFFENIKFA